MIAAIPQSISAEESGENRVYFKFRAVRSDPFIMMRLFGDFDGDGFEEVVSSKGWGAVIENYDHLNPVTSCHLMGADSVNNLAVFDFNDDLAPEVLLFLYKNNEAWINVYDIKQVFGGLECTNILSTEHITGADINQDGFWDGALIFAKALDVNADGHKDLIAAVRTGYDRNPRGLIAFDGITGEIIRRHMIGAPPSNIEFSDIDADGVPEIIMGTWAPGNGVAVNGICDTVSNLIALDRQGRELWKVPMGLSYFSTWFTVADLNDDGRDEIIARYASGETKDQNTKYELQIRDVRDGRIVKYFRQQDMFGEIRIVDLNSDGRYELIALNEDGKLYYLDDHLKLLGKYKVGDIPDMNWIPQVVDIDMDGRYELIVCDPKGIYILNDRFEVVGRLNSDFRIREENVHFFRHPVHGNVISVVRGTIANYSEATIYQITIGDTIVPPQSINYGTVALLLIFASGALLALMVLWSGQKLLDRKRRIKSQTAADNRFALLQTLSAFGHGKTATANLDRLSLLFINLPETGTVSVEYLAKLDDSIKTFFDFTLLRLKEIIARIQSAGVGLSQLNGLNSNLDRLINFLEDYKSLGVEGIKREQYKKDLPKLNGAIETGIKLVITEISYYYSCRIVNVVNEVLAALNNELIENKINFGNMAISGNPSLRVFIAHHELVEILEELIRNALRAMQTGPGKNLNINIEVGECKVFIDVIDSGVGIAEDQLDQIFNRDFTTREEGGYGLYHCKTILDKYGAKIKVAASVIGQGTTMRLELKKVS